jgi:fructokinase
MNRTFKIAGLGEVLWDAYPDGEKFGGAPANFACHCLSLGAEAYVVSCIGADQRGFLAREFLETQGVDTTCLVESPDHETGVVNVTLNERGIPKYEIKEGVAWDHIPLTPEMEALAPQLDAVCFGSLCQRSEISYATIKKFLAATSPECLVVFDVNLRQSFYNDGILTSSLRSADMLKLNDEEFPAVVDMLGPDAKGEGRLKILMKKFNLKMSIMTYGADGALLMMKDAVHFASPPKS